MASKKKKDPYSPETVRKKREFPVLNTVLIILCVIGQLLLVFLAVWYQPEPLDKIDEYNVTVTPLSDGSLDITYDILWTALDETEPLTWVEIGMANRDFSIYSEGQSGNIDYVEKFVEDGYCSARVYFQRQYYGGDTLRFSFKVNQKKLMCYHNSDEVIYEFVPGWFNETPVESYTFKWLLGDGMCDNNAHYLDGGFGVWEGSLECGDYEMMRVFYSNGTFSGNTVPYLEFDDGGAYNSLQGDKTAVIFICVLGMILLLVFEVIIVDSYVSYGRGRGFIRGYGYHMHVYGRVNPHYRTARDSHISSRGGGIGGGGCACACACACAGGGRAGCSLKDTYGRRYFKRDEKK